MNRNEMQLDDFYRKYMKALYFYLYKLCGSRHIAEDLVQETFVRATILLNTTNEEYAKAWLFKVARNTYLDEWRKEQRRKQNPLFQLFLKPKEMISPYGLPEDELLEGEQSEQIQSVLLSLPENYRTILYLREEEGFTYQEIARVMQLTEEQVKITLHRARKRLAELAQKRKWS